MFVKLQRPPPEIRIFLPARSARSSTATLRPRLPASAAQNRPAAPAPRTMASNRRELTFVSPPQGRTVIWQVQASDVTQNGTLVLVWRVRFCRPGGTIVPLLRRRTTPLPVLAIG